MKSLDLLTTSIAVVIVEIFVALVFLLFPLLVLGVDVSVFDKWILFYLFWVIVVSGTIVITLGIPIYLILERKNWTSTLNLAVIGFLIPIVIFLAASVIFTVSSGFSSGQNYYGIYRDMVVNGERTLWGWISFGEDALKFGIHGLIGAIVFGKTMSAIGRKRT